jgi:hypothetical protein
VRRKENEEIGEEGGMRMRRMERKEEDGEKEGMRRTRRGRRDEKENCFMYGKGRIKRNV